MEGSNTQISVYTARNQEEEEEEEHSSVYRGCKVSKRAAELQRIKTTQGIGYAEAVKKVTGDVQIPRPNGTTQK